MIDSAVLEQSGLLTVNDFLDRKLCVALCQEIKNSELLTTPLPENRIEGIDYENGNTRPRVVFDISRERFQPVQEKLRSLIPSLEARFENSFSTFADSYGAVYRTGNYLGKHADGAETKGPDGSKIVYDLQLVIFLNDETEEKTRHGFQGGRLTIYGLLKDEVFGRFGYPIKARAGQLVAFQSKLVHEVTPVTSGVRYSINTAVS